MTPGDHILLLAKASPDDFLAGLKSLSNQERVEVDRKMRQLEDKHQDEFSKDSGRREQTRRGFLSTLGLGAAGVGAAVASKLLPGGKVVGDKASDAVAAREELANLRKVHKTPQPADDEFPLQQEFRHPFLVLQEEKNTWKYKQRGSLSIQGDSPGHYLREFEGLRADARNMSDYFTANKDFYGPTAGKLARHLRLVGESPAKLNREQMADLVRSGKSLVANTKRFQEENAIRELWEMGEYFASHVDTPRIADDATVGDLVRKGSRNSKSTNTPFSVFSKLFKEKPELLEKFGIGKPEDLSKLPVNEFAKRFRQIDFPKATGLDGIKPNPDYGVGEAAPNLAETLIRVNDTTAAVAEGLYSLMGVGKDTRVAEEELLSKELGLKAPAAPRDRLEAEDTEYPTELYLPSLDKELADKWADYE